MDNSNDSDDETLKTCPLNKECQDPLCKKYHDTNGHYNCNPETCPRKQGKGCKMRHPPANKK